MMKATLMNVGGTLVILALAASASATNIDIKNDAALQQLASEIGDDGTLKGYKNIVIGDEVTTLQPLSNLVEVKKGSLKLEDTSKLTDLVGLENLSVVGENLVIEDSSGLSQINLPTLSSVGMSVIIDDNSDLQSIQLPSLGSIGMNLKIEDNAALETLSIDIGSVGMNTDIDNEQLANLQARFGSVGMNFALESDALESLNGLDIGSIGMKFDLKGEKLPSTLPPSLAHVAGMGANVNGQTQTSWG